MKVCNKQDQALQIHCSPDWPRHQKVLSSFPWTCSAQSGSLSFSCGGGPCTPRVLSYLCPGTKVHYGIFSQTCIKVRDLIFHRTALGTWRPAALRSNACSLPYQYASQRFSLRHPRRFKTLIVWAVDDFASQIRRGFAPAWKRRQRPRCEPQLGH